MDTVPGPTTVTFARGFGLCEVIDMTRQIDDCLNARRARLRDYLVTVSVKSR